MANNITLVNIRVAVINCTAGRGMQVRTVSRYGDFVIIRLWEELEVDLEYTLSTIFTYHWIKDGPITLKQTMARMQLQPGKAHLAYPCYDKKDFVVPINLRLITPRRVKAISNEGYECKPRNSWPHDITGFLWTCGVLKGGDKERWDQYGKQFVISESHAYTMLMLTSDLDKAYKKTELRLFYFERTSTAVALANVACFIGSARCAEFTAGLENLVVDSDFKSSVQNLTLLAPEAVACNLASSVADDAAFDAKLKDAPLSMRLAFAACVREGIGEERLKRLALDAISNDLDREGTTNVRLSPYLRKKILDLLKLQEPSPLSQS
ncbi:hypothetical protein V5799_027756 [Amblyomma americanum]|uniref:Uncharacterized protein n=1 Tax=Amblyomma americanum TaxID=6943 RepID=A0AAQ4DET8_AMBAM